MVCIHIKTRKEYKLRLVGRGFAKCRASAAVVSTAFPLPGGFLASGWPAESKFPLLLGNVVINADGLLAVYSVQ